MKQGENLLDQTKNAGFYFELSRNSKHNLGEEGGKTCDDQALVLKYALEHNTREVIQRVDFSSSGQQRAKAKSTSEVYIPTRCRVSIYICY